MSTQRVYFPTTAALVFAGALLCTNSAQAQVLYGSIVGSVTDEAHGSVPGAKVRITSPRTNQTREAVSDTAGTYTLASVPADTYDISIMAQGFQVFKVAGVSVT